MFSKTSLFSIVVFKAFYFIKWWQTFTVNQEAIKVPLRLSKTEFKVVHTFILSNQKHAMAKMWKKHNLPSLPLSIPMSWYSIPTCHSSQSMSVDWNWYIR